MQMPAASKDSARRGERKPAALEDDSPRYAPIALGRRAVSEAIGLGRDSDWLLDPDCPVPKCDIRKPGARVALWVWLWDDLKAFVESRRVLPGHPNAQDL